MRALGQMIRVAATMGCVYIAGELAYTALEKGDMGVGAFAVVFAVCGYFLWTLDTDRG